MSQRITGRSSVQAVEMAKAVGAGMLLTVLGALAAALLVSSERLKTESVGYVSMAVWVAAGWTVSWFAKRKAAGNSATQGLIGVGIYFLCLLGLNALLFGGHFSGMGVTVLLLILGWGLSLLRIRKGRGAGRVRYKIPK